MASLSFSAPHEVDDRLSGSMTPAWMCREPTDFAACRWTSVCKGCKQSR
ncbi:hypothetical protein ACFP51_34085 [Streptomyces pratens]|uniref:Uncharacterized protein n=1 Tax=Streptomyces pratens TaxID=887456 RepID=A0ABW1MC41_9ACTN